MAAQAYWEGDWYVCLVATAAGESPGTHPSKWAKLTIPAKFERYLVQAAYAGLLPGEGQNDKAGAERRQADALLQETRHRCLSQNGDPAASRPNVQTR